MDRVPVNRAGLRSALLAGAVAMAGVAYALSRPTDRGPTLDGPATAPRDALADQDPERTADLLAALRAPDGSVRVEVLEVLTATRARTLAVLPTVLALLTDATPAVRARCSAAIARLGRDGTPALPTMVAVLVAGGPDADVRRAIEGIGEAAPAALAAALPPGPGQGLDDLLALAQALLPRLPPGARAGVWARLTAWWLGGATSTTPGGEESLAILLASVGAREPLVIDALKAGLESDQRVARERAARVLGRLPGMRALLIDRLTSPEAGERHAALLGLAEGHGSDPQRERTLALTMLGDAAPEVREEVAVLLLDTPDSQADRAGGFTPEQRKRLVEILAEMLGRSAPDRRRFAAGALRAFHEGSPEAVAALGAVLSTQDEELRRIAIEVLTVTPQPLGPAALSIVALLERVEAKDAVRVLNLVARAGAEARGATGRLVSLYDSVDRNLRALVLQTLSKVDPTADAVLPTLRAAVADAEEQVQLAALACAAALGPTADPLAADLLRWLADVRAEVAATQVRRAQRASAQQQLLALLCAMGARSPEVRAAARQAVREADDDDRPRLLRALQALGNQEPTWKEALQELLDDSDEAVRAAASSVSSSGDVPAVDPLAGLGPDDVTAWGRLLAHRDRDVRQQATAALQRTKEPLEHIAEDVLAALERSQTEETHRVLLRLLPRLGPAAARAGPALAKALRVPSTSAHMTATDVLRALKLPTGDMVPVLRACLAEPGGRAVVLAIVKVMGAEAKPLQPDLLALVRTFTAAEPVGPRAPRDLVDAVGALAAAGDGLPDTWTVVVRAWKAARDEKERHAVVDALRMLTPLADEDVAPLFALLPGAPEALEPLLMSAVGQLAERGAPAVPWLTQRLRATQVEARENAAWALSRMGSHARPALPVVLEIVRQGPPASRIWALLRGLCHHDIDAFLAAIPEVPANDRRQMLHILDARLDEFVAAGKGEPAAAALLALCRDPAPGMMPTPGYSPGKDLLRALPSAPAALGRLLDDAAGPPGPWTTTAITLAAASATARAGAVERLAAPSADRRLGGLAVLCSLSIAEWADAERNAIVARLLDEDTRLRFRAAEMLTVQRAGVVATTQMDEAARVRVVRVALEALRSADQGTKDWPFQALWSGGPAVPEAGPELARLLLDEEDPQRATRLDMALEAQAKTSADAVRVVLEAGLASADDARRARAVYGWVTVGLDRARAADLLPALFVSPHRIARLTAIHTCGMLDQEPGPIRTLLVARLRDEDRKVRAAAAAMLMFTAKADPEVVEALRKVILDPAVEGREDLVGALQMGHEAIVPILVACLDDKLLRTAALGALSGLGPKAKTALPRLEKLRYQLLEQDADLRRHVEIVIDSIRPTRGG